MKNPIIVETIINAPIEKIWRYWNEPEHIKNWCFASSDWCVPNATNDLRTGGKFSTRMESTDGKRGFDFNGVYTDVVEHKKIEYTIEDGRNVRVDFVKIGDVSANGIGGADKSGDTGAIGDVYKVIESLRKHELASFYGKEKYARNFIVESPTVVLDKLKKKKDSIEFFNLSC
jgi:uncharacterized protein YndB with AHSA1/START domain